jgi:hypothetical protein
MRTKQFLLYLILCGTIYSCKKANDLYFQNEVPFLDDAVSYRSFPSHIKGSLIAVKRTFIYINGVDTASSSSVDGRASFLKNEQGQSGANAGSVSLNYVSMMPHLGTSLYYNTQSGDSFYFINPYFAFNIDTNTRWEVSGSSEIPAFVYNYMGTFPDYKGALPFTISKATGLTLTFDSTTVTGADSVYIAIADSLLQHVYDTFASATAGAFHISPSDLAKFSNVFTYSGVTGAWIKIYPYKYTVQTFGGKQFAFVKEREIWHAITIQ